MQFTDTHAHYFDRKFDVLPGGAQGVLNDPAFRASVRAVINIGTNLQNPPAGAGGGAAPPAGVARRPGGAAARQDCCDRGNRAGSPLAAGGQPAPAGFL